MQRTPITFNIADVPPSIQPYLHKAAFYDSSGHKSRTFYVEGSERLYLKIDKRGSLDRQRHMTAFMNSLHVAPQVIAFDSDEEHDYLLMEAASGEDGTAAHHLDDPAKLASVFGQCLRMLHSLSVDGCPYPNRTIECIQAVEERGIATTELHACGYSPKDNVLLHGDYCLPNIMLDRFDFKAFIDVGDGGIGDRHCDLYWGIWTLNYNLKTDGYKDVFLDAYGRENVDPHGLHYFTKLVELENLAASL